MSLQVEHKTEKGTVLFVKVPECIEFQHQVTIHEPIKNFIHYYTGIEDELGHYHNLEAHDIYPHPTRHNKRTRRSKSNRMG